MAPPARFDLLPLEACADRASAGGKAVGLARLIAGGLPVPPGFVVPCAAYRAAYREAAATATPPVVSAELADAVCAEWRQRGSPTVAVRSSATVEDTAGQSMAGRFATVVGVASAAELVAAVETCWRSLGAAAGEHGGAAMAVIVQRIVPADVAGVVFTADPATGDEAVMVIEASWGLGEAIVSGHVQPDRLHLASSTGEVLERVVADKASWIPPGGDGLVPVPEDRRRIPCLTDAQVEASRDLALAAARLAGRPQDIELAIEGERIWLLQSREITTLVIARARTELRDAMRDAAQTLPGGPWVAHNLGETLRHPTPFTWDVMRRFMAGDGGFGDLYRRAGFAPAASVATDGFLELLGGRIYADTARAAEVFCADYPYAYDLDLLRADPGASELPPTIPRGSARRRRAAQRLLARATRRLRALATDHNQRLEGELVPAFEAWCAEEESRGLEDVADEAWHAVWERRETRVHRDFAPESLLPSLIIGLVLADLRELLDEHCWREDRRELLNQLASTPRPDSTLEAVAGLYRLAHGGGDLEEWTRRFGHRAPDEMELATPRWRETPDAVREMIGRLEHGPDPLEQHRLQHERCLQRIDELRARLPAGARAELDSHLELLRRTMHWREDAKHSLMRGHDLLRRTALDAGRRLGIREDVFLLTPGEVRDALARGAAPQERIDSRRLRRRAEAELSLPRFVDRESLARCGAPAAAGGGDAARLPAFPLSAGVGRGAVRKVRSPREAGALEPGAVLVCPSTDPAWTPLLAGAAALVLERGGTLSHGAIVCREMGVPAVVLDRALELLDEGEVVTVDGAGAVLRRGEEPRHHGAAAAEPPSGGGAHPPRIEDLEPPPLGRRERRAGKLTALGIAGWGLFLLACWLLPSRWLWDPSMAVLDAALWPLVRALGMPGATAAIATALAVLSIVGQRVLTDNERLRAAKRRADLAARHARDLPAGSARRRQLEGWARAQTGRLLLAAMTPLALGLGPMILVFLWCPARLDPASWRPPEGTPVDIVATVASRVRGPVVLRAGTGVDLEWHTPAEQRLQPIRETLEELRDAWRAAGSAEELPDDLRAPALRPGAGSLTELERLLAGELPPQQLSWRLRLTGPEHPGSPQRITVSAGDESLGLDIVCGREHPPRPTRVDGPGDTLRALEAIYAPPGRPTTFWRPLAWLGIPWDAGWLGTYLLAYLPVMYVVRRLLRVP